MIEEEKKLNGLQIAIISIALAPNKEKVSSLQQYRSK